MARSATDMNEIITTGGTVKKEKTPATNVTEAKTPATDVKKLKKPATNVTEAKIPFTDVKNPGKPAADVNNKATIPATEVKKTPKTPDTNLTEVITTDVKKTPTTPDTNLTEVITAGGKRRKKKYSSSSSSYSYSYSGSKNKGGKIPTFIQVNVESGMDEFDDIYEFDSLLGCCKDMETCGLGCFCFWCLIYCSANDMSAAGHSGGCIYCCLSFCVLPCAPICLLRSKARFKYEIEGTCFDDCCASVLCPCCALIQVANKIRSMGDHLGLRI